jgi:hypothetical protein
MPAHAGGNSSPDSSGMANKAEPSEKFTRARDYGTFEKWFFKFNYLKIGSNRA